MGLKRGFTLIEILITTVVFSLAVVFIFQALFVSLDGLSYYTAYLHAAPWIHEKIWTTQDALMRDGPRAQFPSSGSLTLGNRSFDWNLACPLIDQAQGLYRIDFDFTWKQGARKYRINRVACVRYVEP